MDADCPCYIPRFSRLVLQNTFAVGRGLVGESRTACTARCAGWRRGTIFADACVIVSMYSGRANVRGSERGVCLLFLD